MSACADARLAKPLLILLAKFNHGKLKLMRLWKEKYGAWESRKFDGMFCGSPHHLREPLGWIYFVRVCSFTFSFDSVEQIQEYLDYYSQKVHPSSAMSNVPASGWEFQTRFDELPLYLREESKRQKVIKALSKAIAEFDK